MEAQLPGLDRGEDGALRLVHINAVAEAAVRGELAQMFADNFAEKHADAPAEVAAAAPNA